MVPSALLLITSSEPWVLPWDSHRLHTLPTHAAPPPAQSRQRILAHPPPAAGPRVSICAIRAITIGPQLNPQFRLRGWSRSFYCCDEALTNPTWRIGVYFLLLVTAHHQVKPRQELKAATGSPDHGGCCSLPCILGLLSQLSYTAQATCIGKALLTDAGPPASVIR